MENYPSHRISNPLKVIAFLLCFILAFEQSGFAQLAPSGGVAGQLDIASHLSGLSNPLAQDKFRPLHLRYLGYEGSNFKLLLDKGDFFSRPAIKQSISLPSVIASPEQSEGRSNLKSRIASSPPAGAPRNDLESETNLLLNYFFIGLALPNSAFWVNLRPYSPDNIIDSDLAKTDL